VIGPEPPRRLPEAPHHVFALQAVDLLGVLDILVLFAFVERLDLLVDLLCLLHLLGLFGLLHFLGLFVRDLFFVVFGLFVFGLLGLRALPLLRRLGPLGLGVVSGTGACVSGFTLAVVHSCPGRTRFVMQRTSALPAAILTTAGLPPGFLRRGGAPRPAEEFE
jgi:hypothetical protein